MTNLEMASSHVSQAIMSLRRERSSQAEQIIGELTPIAAKIDSLEDVIPFTPRVEVFGNLTIGYSLQLYTSPKSFTDARFESAAGLRDALQEAQGKGMDLL